MSVALVIGDDERGARDPRARFDAAPVSGSVAIAANAFGSARSAAPCGLGEIDRALGAAGEAGMIYVEGGDRALAAIERHVDRRARASGRLLVRAGGPFVADAWREVALRLGVADRLDPAAAGEAIAAAARGAIVLVTEGSPTLWGRSVAVEIARGAGANGCLVVALTGRAPGGTNARVIELGPGLSADEARLWWEAIAADPEHASAPSIDSVEGLDAWWAAARGTPIGARAATALLSDDEAQILRRLALSGRSWSERDAARFGSEGALRGLLARGVLTLDGFGCVAARAEAGANLAARADDAGVVAGLLEALAAHDPWALVTAAELHAAAGSYERAEQAAVRALSGGADPVVRADLWRRYERAIALVPDDLAAGLRLRAAELALRLGDADRALGLAQAAAAELGDTFAVVWAIGSAACARGDLTTAAIAFDQALERAPDAAARARVAAQTAEARYLAGEFDEARRLAEDARRGAADAATRLAARNVEGKILLARAAWSEAERHFAADAHDAACSGEPAAELRARLNRAIARLQSGRRDEARAMLLDVLAEGERRDEAQAVSRALHNLAVIADWQHAYGEALDRYTQAFAAVRRLGDRILYASLVVSLAELKLRLNHLREAEQILAFGRQACGPAMPGALTASFNLVTARLHLAEGRTAEAGELIRSAIRDAAVSRNGDCASQSRRVAARIALEEGDLIQAELAVAAARAAATTPEARAEVAILDATWRRAAGEPFGDAALAALELVRQTEGVELPLEAHLLVCRFRVDRGELRLAQSHAASAAALRDRMARGLPDEVRARLLERRDLVELARIEAALRASVERPSLAVAPLFLPLSVELPTDPGEAARSRIVGRDPAIHALRAAIRKAGPVDATVLIRGESGTGKELVAEALHEASPRRRGPLVKVNCAALVETLLLSELFGHEKGAFTGATARRPGRFEAAEGGTLFLDEIGDISPRTQTALLRVLQERTFERVGGTATIRSDCRVVCATHRDLRAMVESGAFREDLYYRLHGLVLQVPALRSRVGDLSALAEEILRRIAVERGERAKRLSPQALTGLGRHPWPGNVRELENALRAATLFADAEVLEVEDFARNVESLAGLLEPTVGPSGRPVPAPGPTLPPAAANAAVPVVAPSEATYAYVRSGVPFGEVRRRLERECIAMALAESGGNITRAAALLGMKRSRLSQLVKEHGLRSSEIEPEETES